MGDDITIGVTEITNLIEVTSQPNDQIIDIGVTDNTDNVTINVTPSVIEINIIKGDGVSATVSSVNGYVGDVVLTKTDLGLSNVDNTSDLNKPISTSTQSALDLKVPYTGAISNVNLGEFQLLAGQITFEQTPTQTAGVGVLRWNDTDGTLDLGLKGGNVTLQIGQEQLVRVVNKTGSNILEANYQAVRFNGAQGQRPKIALAQADVDANSADTIGLVTETINDNQEGFITVQGLVNGINTTGSLQGETWADGDILYLSPFVAGKITNIKPTAPNHTVMVGYLIYSHITQGRIYVNVQNGYELEELHNVLITTPLNNEGLFYETSSALWKNKSISTVLGYTPAANVLNNYIAQNHPTSFDTTSYDAFPLIMRSISNKIFLFYRVGTAHVNNGAVIVMKTSNDGGATWTSASTVISDASYDCRNISGGVTSTGRIILYFLKYNATTSLSVNQGYIYSDNEGTTWSSYTTIETNSNTFYSPYGGLVSIGDGKIMQGWYGENGTSSYTTYVKISSDNGATWGSSIVVATSPTTRFGEASYAYLDGGIIIGIVRNSAGAVLQQVKSIDNGATWSVIGAISFDTGAHVSPNLITYVDSNNEKYVVCSYANRTDNNLKAIVGTYSGIIAGVSGWNSLTRTDLATNTNTDFGYPTFVKSIENNKFLLSFYKGSSASVANINFLNYTPKNGTIEVIGSIIGTSIIKSGGTSSQFLKADGSIDSTIYQTILTNPITGTGTSGQVSFFNGTSTLTGDNGLFWDNTNKRLGVGTITPVGVFNAFSGISGITLDIANQQSGSISFANNGSASAVPTIAGKSSNNGGLTLIGATIDGITGGDMLFDVRKNDNTDFTTLTNSAFRFRRFGNVLIDVLRNGNTTFTGNVICNNIFFTQATPTAKTATATLTIAEILTNIITVTSATAVTLTLPTGTLTDAGVLGGTLATNGTFEWTIINLGSSSGAVTMAVGTGHTYVGNATIAIGTSATFKTRKTATNTYVTYKI